MSDDAQGLVAVAKKDVISSVPQEMSASSAIVLIAQGRDPDNVGTITRAADAMGAAIVIAAVDTVEVGNPKVLRTSAGSVFHLPIMIDENFESAVRMAHSFKGTVLETSGGFGTLNLDELIKEAHTGSGPLATTHAWAFGDETKSLSPAELKTCDSLVSVPTTGAVESLSAASAAAMRLPTSQNVYRPR